MEAPPSRFESPPPRFSVSEVGTPRFTEHFNESPPYQPYRNFEGQPIGNPQYPESGEDRGIGHRLSNKDRPYHPTELVSSLPETYRSFDEEKEVAIPPVVPEPYQRHEAEPPKKKRICGMAALWVWVMVGVLLVLAVALGVGLGVGLNQKDDNDAPGKSPQDSEYRIGGSIDPKFYSDEGAFNGSGIALASQSFSRQLSQGTQGNLVLYFQHWTGDIRWKQLSNTGDWLGGDFSAVVAKDAKNNTPLSAVSYVLDGVSQWHVFYIDRNNTIKQRSNTNSTNVWQDGPINKLKLKTFDAELVGMQACWYGNDYGDSDYFHTPLPNEDPSANRSHEVGMHIWYASNESTFEQLGWRDGDDSWEHQLTWTGKNGHAGVGCYSWGPGTVTYVMFVNTENTVEFWWRDTNTNTTDTSTHPINQWTNTSIAINNVHPATSLGYTNYFYAQMDDSLLFNGYNISWHAENTKIIQEDSFTVQGEPGIPGSHLSVSAIPNNSGGNDLVVFYQTNGSDISEYTRDLVAGQWSNVEIDIPK